MPVSESGRILIQIDPELKGELYETLKKDGKNLKGWFLENVDEYLSNRSQLKLFSVSERAASK